MADQVEKVKSKIDIVSLVGEYVDLKKAGTNYKGLCPFHSEKTPSFMVSPELQIYKCFGCGESGDAFSFLQDYEGMDFREALEFLADRAGVELEPYRGDGKSKRKKIYEINSQVARFYQHVLLNHSKGKDALIYLKKDREISEKIIKKFKIGYSPDVPLAYKKFLIDKKGYKLDDLDQAGLVYRSRGRAFDRFRGRVTFPLFDHRGNVVGFSGRVLPGKSKDRAKYINTPETAAYNKSRTLYGLNETKKDIKKKNFAVVVEGELDMISSWKAGVKNTIAIKGSALTEGQVKLLSRFTKEIVLALDADFAGDLAARRGIEIAEGEGMEVSVVRLGKYKDPDEAARKDPDKYKKLIGKPIPVWDFIVDSVFERFDETTGPGKAKISKELVPLLSSIEDKIVQNHYVKEVAKRLGVEEEAVLSQVQKRPLKKKEKRVVKEEEKSKTRRELLEERFLSLTFKIDPKIAVKKKSKDLINTSLTRKIVTELDKYIDENKKLDLSDFASSLPKELFDGFAQIALKDDEDLADSESEFESELEMVKKDLIAIGIKEKLEELEKKIKKEEKDGSDKKLEKLKEEFDKLVKELSEIRQFSENPENKVLLD